MICLIASGDYFSNYGGGQVYVRHLARGLMAHGDVCVVSIAAGNGSQQPPQQHDDNGLAVWQLHVDGRLADSRQPLELQPGVLRPLKALLKQIAPQLVHAHGWKAATATVCRQIDVPCIITAHHGGIVCPNGTLLNQHDQLCQVPVSRKACLSCTLHTAPGGRVWGPLVQALPQPLALGAGRLLQQVRNIPYTSPAFKQPLAIANKQAFIDVLRTCPDAVVAPSHAIAEALVRNGVPAASVVVIPHGIPLPERKPLQQGLGRRPLRFVYVGRISRVKGLHVMLQALSGLSGGAWELHIIGAAVTKPEQRYRAMLQRRYTSVNVHWHGGLPAEQVLQWLYHCDVMIHPAICLEVFGLTIAEAMAAGRPVIASRCGGAEMQIQDGENGWLVPANHVDALRQRIDSLIQNPEQVQIMASKLGEVNSLAQHVNDIVGLYQRVLAGREKDITP